MQLKYVKDVLDQNLMMQLCEILFDARNFDKRVKFPIQFRVITLATVFSSFNVMNEQIQMLMYFNFGYNTFQIVNMF